MLKFQRNYYIEFKIRELENGSMVDKEVVTVSYPTTLNLNISLGSYLASNSAQLSLYNLSREIQAKLWRDVYNNGNKQILMSIYAGYGSTMPLVFMGWVQSCTSYRSSGSVDWVTELQAFEGGYLYQYGFINATFTEYTKLADVINYMLEQDVDTKVGCISPELKDFPRNKTFIGQPIDLLHREYNGYEVFIDKGKLHILGENDVVKGELLVITDETGLLGSPKRANAFLELDIIFEPQVRVGQAISLLCDSMPQFNQAYKIVAIQHTGTISDRVCGNLKTHLTLSMLDSNYKTLEEEKPATYEEKNTSQWQVPVSGGKITSQFGKRDKPTEGASTYHKGIDIGVKLGTPVYAPADGKVIFANWLGGYGKAVQIDNGVIDGKKVSSKFGHLNSWVVKAGQNVYKGETIIGYVGSTGVSTGPHLHFEVSENGSPVNPLKYIGGI